MTQRELWTADPRKPSDAKAIAFRVLGKALGLGVLIGLEAAWLLGFLCLPLPNAPTNLGVVRRGIFLLQFFPWILPQIRFEQSHLGLAIEQLSHLENLPQRLPLVLAAGLIAGSAIALGRLALRWLDIDRALDAWERSALAFGLGTTGLGLLTMIVGRLGMLSTWPVRAGLLLFIAVELMAILRDRFFLDIGARSESVAVSVSADHRPRAVWSIITGGVGFLLIVGPFLLVMALGAMVPTIDYDALSYHLQGPKEFYLQGRITFLPHNVYTSMPFGVEMLHLLGMVVIGDWWHGALVGQLLVALFAPATAVLIARTAGRWWSDRSGWYAAVVYLTTPWIYRLAVAPYVEGPLCYFHAALVAMGLRTLRGRHPAHPLLDHRRVTGWRRDGLQVPRAGLGRVAVRLTCRV